MDRKTNTPPPCLAQARHVIELASGDVPAWVELIPAGQFSGRDGRGPYSLDTAAVQHAFASWGMPLAIDYEHQAFNAAENGQPAPAAGWVNAIEIRDGALWGQVEWTERAAGHVAAREYRFLSPVFDHDKQGHVLRLLGAGLTNNPNLYLTALNRRAEFAPDPSTHRLEKPMDELLERIRYMLNLPVTATPEEIKGHIQRLIDAIDAPATVAMQSTLGLTEKLTGATLPELLQAAHARLTATESGATPDPARYVPRAEFERVTHSLADLQAKTDGERVERIVQAAMAAHKVSPGMEAWARSYCKADQAGFEAYLETAPVLMPGGGQASHAAQRIADNNAANPLLVDADRRAGR